jgi:hypothetical protein
MEKVASSAATAGVDFDHLMGYLGKMINYLLPKQMNSPLY